MTATPEILDGLREIEALIEGYVDVIDGPNGEQFPNKAMEASTLIERLIAKAEERVPYVPPTLTRVPKTDGDYAAHLEAVVQDISAERTKLLERNRALEEESAQRTVVIVGNPLDGVSVVGPFADDELAATWCERRTDNDWWLAHLAPIDSDEETP